MLPCPGLSSGLKIRKLNEDCHYLGAAFKDSRLRPGDQILEVMKEDLRNVTHSFALHALRQTPNKVG